MCEVKLQLVDICKIRKRRAKPVEAKKIEPGPFDLYLMRKSKQKLVKSGTKKRKTPKKAATAKKKAAKPLMENCNDEISTIGGSSCSDGDYMTESSMAESSYNIQKPRKTRRRNISRKGLLSKKSDSYLSDTDVETVQPLSDRKRKSKKRDNQDDTKLRQNPKVIVNSFDNCYSTSEPNQWCDISEDSSIRQLNTLNSVKTASIAIVPCGSAIHPAHSKNKHNSTATYPLDKHLIEMNHSGNVTTQSCNAIESSLEIDVSARTAYCHNTTSNVPSIHTAAVVRLRRLSARSIYNQGDNISEPTVCSASTNRVAQIVPVTEQSNEPHSVIANLRIPPSATEGETNNKPIKKRILTTKSPKSTKKRNKLSITQNQPPTENEFATVISPPVPQRIRVRPIAELVQQQITPVLRINKKSAVPIRKLALDNISTCRVLLDKLSDSQNVARFHAPAEETAELRTEYLIEPENPQTVRLSPHFTNRAIEMDVSANTVVNDVGTEATTGAVLYEAISLIDEDAENDAEIEQINRNHDSDSDHFPENHYSSGSDTSGMNTNPRSPQQSPISPFAYDNAANTVDAVEVYPSSIEPPQTLICIAIEHDPSINALDLSQSNSSRCMNNDTISSTIRSSPINSSDDRHIHESFNDQNQTSNTIVQQHPQSPQAPLTEATTESTRIPLDNGDDTSMDTLEVIDDIVSPEYEEHISPISPVVAKEPIATRIPKRRNTDYIPQRIPRKLANNVILQANVTPLRPKAIGIVSEQRVTSSQEDLIAFANKSMERFDTYDLISSTIYTLGDENYKKRLGIENRRYTTVDIVQGKPNINLIDC